jgi:hypothetical protein
MKQEINVSTSADQPDAVLAAVWAVMKEVTVIAKGDRGPKEQGSYKFRSADDVVDTLGPAFRQHGLFLQSEVVTVDNEAYVTTGTDRQGNERVTHWCRTRVVMNYQITSLVDGSSLHFGASGEGLDQSDKSSNKALTAAMKYALCQAFVIPTGDPDPDSESPMVDTPAARAIAERRAQEQAARPPAVPVASPVPAPAAEQSSPTAQPEQERTAAQSYEEKAATVALTEAAKQFVQIQERGDTLSFSPEQLDRAAKAHQVAITGNRALINRVIIQAKAEGIMQAPTHGDTVLHAVLGALREVSP